MHRNEENVHKGVTEKGSGSHKLEIKNMLKKREKKNKGHQERAEKKHWEEK